MATNTGGGRVLAVGVALGLASTVLLYIYLKKQSQSFKANWKTVAVAKVEIPANSKITREKIILFPITPELVSPGAVQDLAMIDGKLARTTIRAAAQITTADLMMEGEIPGLAVRVPPGKRAIAIAASEIIAVGTMIKPGDHVDILATYRDPDGRIETTQMILQNAPVLAVNIGQTESTTPEGAKTSMTLAVAPEDTERLTAASVAGVLRVSLRAPNDTAMISTSGVTVKDIPVGRMRVHQEVPVVAPAVAPPPPPVEREVEKPREITIIRGTEARTVTP